MKIILIYLVFFTFYVDQVMGAVGFSHIMRGLSLLNFNIYLLMIVWMASILQRKERRIFIPNNVNKYIVLMAFLLVISIFVKMLHGEIPNINLKKEILDLKIWLNPILIFFLFFNLIDDKKTCNRALLGLCFLFVALIITQLFATYGISDYQERVIREHGRAGGFGAPGEFAISLVLFFPFVLSGGFLVKKNYFAKIGYIILIFLSLGGLVNTGSRNGAVSLIFAMLVYLLLLKRNKIFGFLSIYFLIIAMIAVIIVSFAVAPSRVKMRINKRFDPTTAEDLSEFSSGRSELLKNGWDLFIDSPLFGHGRKSFIILSKLRGYRHVGNAHNEYLKHLVEYGIIGFIVYCMIFFKIFQNIWQSMKTTTNPLGRHLYISFLAGLSGYMIGIFATNTKPSLFIFWIYTAIVYKYAQLDDENKQNSMAYNERVTTLSKA